MKIEIKLNSKELEMLENVFKPINVFAKEIASTDSEDMTETFSMIKRNATAGYTADHKAYTCVLKKEDEEYVVSWDLKDLFIEIVAEFGNKIAKLFVSIAKPILEFCKDPIMTRINELNDDASDENRTAILGKDSVPYISAWRSNKAIEHDKAIMFDIQSYVNSHSANDAIEHLGAVLGNESNVLKYNKAFFISLYEELESKTDDDVLKNICDQEIGRLKA